MDAANGSAFGLTVCDRAVHPHQELVTGGSKAFMDCNRLLMVSRSYNRAVAEF